MNYLLDTNVCVSYLRGKDSTKIEARLAAALPGEVALCSVVKAELLFGAERSQQPQKNRLQLEQFFAAFPSFPFDDPAAAIYGAIRTNLETQGTPIGPNDLMIASIALVRSLTLVTHNVSEFSRVPGLQIEDWQAT
ncbi:MAG: type II toxin-antitoxin system VapC family toxin [Planctomycetes bacterium]|nr:type II toxin-antitoxin system VapC family toxin [Planctomycetota bacterium]MBL7041686.1 type II toxin-antitoxin system VapC family toxin [Pirellulaceae bacterium]